MSTSKTIENLGLNQVVGAVIANDYNIVAAANSLGIKKDVLDGRITELDEAYAGTRAMDVAVASHLGRLFNQQMLSDNSVYGTLNTLINSTVPKDLSARFAKGILYAETDDLLSSTIETKIDFLKSGFRVAASKKEDEEKINKWLESRDIVNTFLNKSPKSIFTNNQTVVMWNDKPKTLTVLPLPNLKIVPLHSTDNDGKPRFKTYLKLPADMIALIRKLKKLQNSEELKGIPEDWIDAATRGNKLNPDNPLMPAGPWVDLAKKGSKDLIFIGNLDGENDRLTNPTITSIFPSLSLRSYLQDGEFSVAFVIKNFIHQIKIGPKTQGTSIRDMLAAKTVGPTDKQEVLDSYSSKPDKAIMTVTDQDEDHNFIFPGSEIKFDGRYTSPDTRILRWGRMSLQIMTSTEGGSFSAGLIYMKGFSKQIDRARDVINAILKQVFKMLGVADARVIWNMDYMKEPKQVLSEVKFEVERGMDMETAIKKLGADWKEWVADREKTLSPEIIAKKAKPDEAWEYWQAIQIPFFEDHQGQLDEGGRPEGDGQQTDKTNAPDTPRAGQ